MKLMLYPARQAKMFHFIKDKKLAEAIGNGIGTYLAGL